MKNFTLPIRFGIATSGSLIAYFLILSLLGLHTNVFFSLFNAVITGFGIYEAIKYYKLENGKSFRYSMGFTAGLTTGGMATIIFTIFFAIYSTELNPGFLEILSTQWASEYQSFEAIVFFVVAVMGFSTTVVLTLTFMQLFKTTNNLTVNKR
ncbi:MAG: putative membrane metal-binding protein [Maribacter sp.]|jgi:predicted membrane metal-binding protein